LTNLCEGTTKEREKENLDGTATSTDNVARDGREQVDGLDIYGNMRVLFKHGDGNGSV
jgi:hypothetical protein